MQDFKNLGTIENIAPELMSWESYHRNDNSVTNEFFILHKLIGSECGHGTEEEFGSSA